MLFNKYNISDLEKLIFKLKQGYNDEELDRILPVVYDNKLFETLGLEATEHNIRTINKSVIGSKLVKQFIEEVKNKDS
jgi:uncharacterized Fe-S cluster-containing MiaB family protein